MVRGWGPERTQKEHKDLNTPLIDSGCQHSDPHLSKSHPTHNKENEREPKRGSPYSLTLKGSELLSSPEEEKRRGRVFDAEVQTENPENNQRGSGGDRRITGPPSIPVPQASRLPPPSNESQKKQLESLKLLQPHLPFLCFKDLDLRGELGFWNGRYHSFGERVTIRGSREPREGKKI